MTELRCSRCQKRLSRKTARLIDGKILCSPCVFATPDKISGVTVRGDRFYVFGEMTVEKNGEVVRRYKPNAQP